MDPTTLDEIERAQEIDDLLSLNRNLNLQLTWVLQQNRALRVRLNRMEAALGMAEAA